MRLIDKKGVYKVALQIKNNLMNKIGKSAF